MTDRFPCRTKKNQKCWWFSYSILILTCFKIPINANFLLELMHTLLLLIISWMLMIAIQLQFSWWSTSLIVNAVYMHGTMAVKLISCIQRCPKVLYIRMHALTKIYWEACIPINRLKCMPYMEWIPINMSCDIQN